VYWFRAGLPTLQRVKGRLDILWCVLRPALKTFRVNPFFFSEKNFKKNQKL
jgi:hypothetical protein